MNAISISIRREGERLHRRYGHDALINAAMLIAVRNPDTTRNDRIALLEELWARIDTRRGLVPTNCATSAVSAVPRYGDGEAKRRLNHASKENEKDESPEDCEEDQARIGAHHATGEAVGLICNARPSTVVR
jgi:hypothetical protein